jgi:predicted RNase H-like nuclease
MARVARGLDGCRGGWLAVTLVDGLVEDVEVVGTISEVPDDGATVAVDMPIGLVDEPVRDADAAARRQLPGRRSSVFNAPPRAVVDAYLAGEVADHAEASALAKRTIGKGITRQTWALLPKIAELDAAVREGRELIEVHPEVAYAEVVGKPLPRKRTAVGITARTRVLERLGIGLPSRFDGRGCARDDVLDAAICAWVADGIALGEAPLTYPAHPKQTDPEHPGRELVICTRAHPDGGVRT